MRLFSPRFFAPHIVVMCDNPHPIRLTSPAAPHTLATTRFSIWVCTHWRNPPTGHNPSPATPNGDPLRGFLMALIYLLISIPTMCVPRIAYATPPSLAIPPARLEKFFLPSFFLSYMDTKKGICPMVLHNHQGIPLYKQKRL